MRCRIHILSIGLAVCLPAGMEGQEHRPRERTVTADGLILDFPPDGVWRHRAGRLFDRRARLLSGADYDALNTAAAGETPGGAAAALAGTLYLPTILIAFADTDTIELSRAPRYDSLYTGAVPPLGRSYSVRTHYEEMSSGAFTVGGSAYGWYVAPNAQTYYLDACGASANALDCSEGRQRMHELFTAALAALDGAIDFRQFDNDGDDGVPDSGDDDGIVDVVQFVQPVLGGECGGRGIWAHRWSLGSIGGTHTTSDGAAGGGSIHVNAYFLSSGVGGAVPPDHRAGCANASEMSGIGTAAHEFGHGIGLPDLYDTGGNTEGAGEWGLMGSGSYTSANSPAHYEAWSKVQMGWVTVRELTAGGTYSLGPVITGDTVLLVRATAPNPRGEYFLIENRQAVGADTANMLVGGNRGPKVGGLLVWHVDSAKITQGSFSNTVNSGSIHGVALVQADGLNQLRLTSGGNRGDAGDPYPGSAANTRFGFDTTPRALRNADGQAAGFEIDSVRQVMPGGAMAFRLRFGFPLSVVVDGPGSVTHAGTGSDAAGDQVYAGGTEVALVAAAQAPAAFFGWTGDTTAAGDTLRLTLTRSWEVTATFAEPLVLRRVPVADGVMGASYADTLSAAGGGDIITWQITAGQLPAGVVLAPKGVLSGVPEAAGSFPVTFRASSTPQTDTMSVTIRVATPALAVQPVVRQLLSVELGLSADEVRYLDLAGNRNGHLDVGDFLAWIQTTGGSVSAEEMAALLRAAPPRRETR